MTTRPCLCLAAILCLVATACGTTTNSGTGNGTSTYDAGNGDGSGAGTDTAGTGSDTISATGSPVAIDSLQAAMVDAVCAAFTKCPDALGLPMATVEGCKAIMGASMTGANGMDSLIALVKSGKVKYDATQAGNCLAGMKVNCNDLSNMGEVAACAATFTGTAAVGAVCGVNEECASAWCSKKDSNCSQGTCQTKLAAAAACAGGDTCVTGYICNGGTCVANTPAKIGEACGSVSCVAGAYCNYNASNVCAAVGDVGATCQQASECKSGLTCKTDPTGTGNCAAAAKVGDTCTISLGSNECGKGLACVGGTVGTPGKCGAVVAVGGACTSPLQCYGYDVGCLGGTCKVLPNKGQSCQAPDMTKGAMFGCLMPFVCANGTCVDPPGVGQPCPPQPGQCASGLQCDSTTNTCKGLPGNGEPCSGSCAPNFTCNYSADKPVCAPATCQ